MKKITLFILVLSIFFISGCFRLATEKPQTIPKVLDKTHYENMDLIIPIPAKMILEDKDDVIKLSHTVEIFSHTDFCDFKGDSLPTTTFRDFTTTFAFSKKSLKETILKFGGEYLQEYFDKNEEILESEGFLEKTKLGNYEGYKLSMGVEGCGYDQYYFPTDKGILFAQKNFVPELTDLNPQKENFASAPGIISPESAQQIFESIIEGIEIK